MAKIECSLCGFSDRLALPQTNPFLDHEDGSATGIRCSQFAESWCCCRRAVLVRAADEDAEDDSEFDQPVDILGTAEREEQVYFGGDIEFDGEIDDALDDVAVNNDYNYDDDDDAPRARRGKRDEQSEDDGPLRDADGFEERVLQVKACLEEGEMLAGLSDHNGRQ